MDMSIIGRGTLFRPRPEVPLAKWTPIIIQPRLRRQTRPRLRRSTRPPLRGKITGPIHLQQRRQLRPQPYIVRQCFITIKIARHLDPLTRRLLR